MTEQTDKPKTVALDMAEYRALALHNIAALHTHLTNNAPTTAEHLEGINQHLTRTLVFLRSWQLQAAAMIAAQEAQGASSVPVAETAAASNGAEPPSRKGGWPKGRKRTRAGAAAGAVQ